MNHDDVPLFAWNPLPCQVIAFPLSRWREKVQDVAFKMSEKTTERHAAYYYDQVSQALFKKLDRYGIPESKQHDQVLSFWRSVNMEIARMNHRNKKPGGAA
jgi:hypothetical protein